MPGVAVSKAGDLRPLWPDAPRFDPRLEFPQYRFLPGHSERPGQGHCEGHGFWAGVDLYHAGYLWEAHEVWEALWKASTDEGKRDFYQALIQIAAALIKVHVRQWNGAGRLVERARERLQRATGVFGVSAAEVLAQFGDCFGEGPEAVVWENAPRILAKA